MSLLKKKQIERIDLAVKRLQEADLATVIFNGTSFDDAYLVDLDSDEVIVYEGNPGQPRASILLPSVVEGRVLRLTKVVIRNMDIVATTGEFINGDTDLVVKGQYSSLTLIGDLTGTSPEWRIF